MTNCRKPDDEMNFPVSEFINRSSYQQRSAFLGPGPEERINFLPLNDET